MVGINSGTCLVGVGESFICSLTQIFICDSKAKLLIYKIYVFEVTVSIIAKNDSPQNSGTYISPR